MSGCSARDDEGYAEGASVSEDSNAWAGYALQPAPDVADAASWVEP